VKLGKKGQEKSDIQRGEICQKYHMGLTVFATSRPATASRETITVYAYVVRFEVRSRLVRDNTAIVYDFFPQFLSRLTRIIK